MTYANRVLLAMILVLGGLIGAAAFYERRHPCLRYSTRRVLVPELTTYVEINGGNSNVSNGGVSIPRTTPAHYEDEMVCENRR
jgi:hypothetical protein